jgi:hypothetical protein
MPIVQKQWSALIVHSLCLSRDMHFFDFRSMLGRYACKAKAPGFSFTDSPADRHNV